MGTIWWLAPFITLLGWIFSPAISFYLNKMLSDSYDASKKVPHLVADTIPILKNSLRKVEEQWMLKKLSPDENSGVFTIEKLESLLKRLKAALYEAEDIIDLVNYHMIDDKARGESHHTTWLQWYCPSLCVWCWQAFCDLYDSIGRVPDVVLQWAKQNCLLLIVGEGLDALWLWVQPRWWRFWRQVRRSGAHLPTYSARPSSPAFKNIFRGIINFFSKAYGSAKDCLGRFNKSYEQDVDCTIMGPLGTDLKENMKRIEELFDEASKCTSFTRRVQETSDQPDQQRINGSGNTANFTNKDEHVTAYPAMKVTGRDRVREQIRAILRNLRSSENGIGICGIPGSGKTTLAQYVYQSEKGGGHFDLVMWIHVSGNFSKDTIFRQMFEEASPNKTTACPLFDSPTALLTELQNKLIGKRLLLVLDDIWDNKVLRDLLIPFKFGSIGSKILVTSRDENALLALRPDVRCKILPIPPLDDNDFLDLLMYYACVDKSDQCGSSQLHKIGGEIAEQLEKSPLAATLVGSRLSRNHDPVFWKSVRCEKLIKKMPGALWWCYQHLDEDVKRCFTYCSIFPRGHHLFRDELVNLWVAEGFITRTNKGEEMEDVGQRYFCQLVSTSFLQLVSTYYLVHDQLHELAVEVAGSDCSRIENSLKWRGNELSSSWDGEVSPDVRHLFVLNYNAALVTGKILKFEKLRTLIIYTVPGSVSVEYAVIESIFDRLRKLRVLAISFTHGHGGWIEKPVLVPESFCQSKHLRYLAFRSDSSGRVTFPSTPTKLYHMQLLDVGHAKASEFTCGDNTKLRHVFGNVLLKVPNMGQMISLQTLAHFPVSKEQGYEVTQLRDLNKLGGSLSISGLSNVMNKVEALEANLAAKQRLRKLTLKWGSKVDPEVESGVLDGLCPPRELETLHILIYNGLRYPNWMLGRQNGDPMNLKELLFEFCSQQGPPPQLKAFIHLQSLKLKHCSWNDLPGNMEDLTSLKVLVIERCLAIRSLPTLPQSIEEFRLTDCDEVFSRSCQEKGHLNWQKIKDIPNKVIYFIPEVYLRPDVVFDGGNGSSFPRYVSEWERSIIPRDDFWGGNFKGF